MSDKCEWKDGEFEPCDTLNFKCEHEVYSYLKHKGSFCPFCGADIRKTEPEVIIRKSGGTWVKRDNGIDYLLMNPEYTTKESFYFYGENGKETEYLERFTKDDWKPISEIEITDEIAKLRPMVKHEGSEYCCKMVHFDINNHFSATVIEPSDCTNRYTSGSFRLATVSDLEDEK